MGASSVANSYTSFPPDFISKTTRKPLAKYEPTYSYWKIAKFSTKYHFCLVFTKENSKYIRIRLLDNNLTITKSTSQSGTLIFFNNNCLLFQIKIIRLLQMNHFCPHHHRLFQMDIEEIVICVVVKLSLVICI